ncbi:MAG: glycosyltransferase family 4 protein [Clostridiales bacterium]|nr:glycosyltransferase family 4 protein [Clostridiales bacterium]
MRILIVCQYYWPEQFLINEIAPELVKRGHEVAVLTGLPNYPEGIVPEEYKHGKRDEVIDGVHVIRCNEHGRGKGKKDLVLNYLSYMRSASKKAKQLDKFDLVLAYQLSPVTMLAPAVAYKKKNHVPILVYCLDIWPESAQAYLGTGKIYRLVAKYSKRLYQKCDEIAVTSEPFINYMEKVNGIDCKNMVYIPQHCNGEMLDLDLNADNNGITDFMFAGNLGKGQKLETIIKAAARLKNRKDFVVHMVGDGSMRESLEQLSKKLGVENKVLFHGKQNRADMAIWYKKADALLITLRGNNFVGNTMPGKLQTYMTTGKPIFGAINGAAQQVITESQCGACVNAEDDEGLSRLMFDYIEHPDWYDACGNNAKQFFKAHFTMDVFMDRLEAEMRELV